MCICGNNGSNLRTHKTRLFIQPVPNKSIAPFGYYPPKRTLGLWNQNKRPNKFTVVVDDFRLKYLNKEYSQHLLNSIEANYAVKADYTGKNSLELTSNGITKKDEVRLSMKGYVE